MHVFIAVCFIRHTADMVNFMKMTVIGAGYVGISVALGFAHTGHEIVLLE